MCWVTSISISISVRISILIRAYIHKVEMASSIENTKVEKVLEDVEMAVEDTALATKNAIKFVGDKKQED